MDSPSSPVSNNGKTVPARMQALLGTNRSAITLAILFCLFAWLIFNWFETVERILHCYSAVPAWDYWRVAYNVPRYKAMDFRVLWTQHNEHRIIFPEIIYAFDILTWHGRQILPLALSFLCYFSTWVLLAWTLFADRRLSSPVRNAAILLAGIVIGWKGSASVLASQFLLQWTLMQFCVFLSLAFISRIKTARTSVYMILAIASAIVATYSSGNGLLVWPVLIAAGLVLRLEKRDMAALGISAFLSVGLYFVGYKFSNDLNIGNLIAHPYYFLGFLGAYLSMPFGGMKTPLFGVYVGLASLSIVSILFTVAVRTRLLLSQPGIVLFGGYSFTLLTAFITAAGRMDPADPNFGSAKADRYLTVPMVTWAVFISICLWISARRRWKIVSPAGIAFLVVLLLAIGFLKLRWWVKGTDYNFSNQQLAALALEEGLVDPGLIRKIFPDPGFVLNCLPILRQSNLSVFYKSRLKWLGLPVGRFSSVLSTIGIGEISYTFPVRSGVEVVGWADLSFRSPQYARIVLTNELGQIVGFGQRLPAGFPADLHSPQTPPSLAWVGFVNLEVKTRSFSAYIVDPHRKGLLPIPGSAPVPQVQAAGIENVGLPIPGIEWQRDESWTLNGFPPRLRFDTPPPDPIFASWSGTDVNTGQMVSSIFPTPANNCMILPVWHGPSVTGQSLEIQDADTGKSIEVAPFQNGDLQWEFWRFPIDPGVRHLRIKAEDEGRDWGEWFAVGPPSECR